MKKKKIMFVYGGMYIGSLKVDDVNNLFNRVFPITIWFKFKMFRVPKLTTVLKPDKLLFNDVIHNKIYVSCHIFGGVTPDEIETRL